MKVALFVTLFALVFGSSRAANPGLKLAVTQDAITYFKDLFMPYVVEAVLNANISTIEQEVSTPIGTVIFTIDNFKINSLEPGKVNIGFEAPHNIKIALDDASMTASLDWKYREKIWPHPGDSGSGDITAKKISLEAVLEVTVNATDGRPIVTAPRIRFKIGKMSIKLHGGASWLYNIFITVFKSTIVDNIEKAVISVFDHLVDTTLADMLRDIPLTIALTKDIGIDYALAADPVVNSEHTLVVSSQAEFYPVSLGPGHSSLAPPVAMPDHATGVTKMFEILLSEYTFNTFAFSATKTGLIDFRVTKEQADANTTYFFSTDFFSFYAPGMVSKYGKDKEISYHFTAQSVPIFDISPKGFTILVPLALTVDVNPGAIPTHPIWEEAFSLAVDASARGNIDIVDNNIVGTLELANASYVLRSTEVGEVQVKSLGLVVDFVVKELVKMLNVYAAKGFPIPSIKGLSFVDPVIEWKNKFVAIATSGKYVMPTKYLKH